MISSAFSYNGRVRARASSIIKPEVPKSTKSNSVIKGRPMQELSSNTTDDLDHEWPFSDEDIDGSDESLDRLATMSPECRFATQFSFDNTSLLSDKIPVT